MLKLNYTDVGLYRSRIMTNPELLIAQRVLLAMRLGRSALPSRRESRPVEPGHASFLLPVDIPELKVLEMALPQDYGSVVTRIAVDEEFVEVGLNGSWIAEDKDAHEGMFLAVMSDQVELECAVIRLHEATGKFTILACEPNQECDLPLRSNAKNGTRYCFLSPDRRAIEVAITSLNQTVGEEIAIEGGDRRSLTVRRKAKEGSHQRHTIEVTIAALN